MVKRIELVDECMYIDQRVKFLESRIIDNLSFLLMSGVDIGDAKFVAQFNEALDALYNVNLVQDELIHKFDPSASYYLETFEPCVFLLGGLYDEET